MRGYVCANQERSVLHYPGCQRFSKRRAAKWREEKRREKESEKTSGCQRQLIDLTAPTDLNLGQDLTLPPDWRNLIMFADWLLLTDRCVVIGCLLIDSLDTYRSMIVRFTLLATRGFSCRFFLSLVLSLHGERKPLGPGNSIRLKKLMKIRVSFLLFCYMLENKNHVDVFSWNIVVFLLDPWAVSIIHSRDKRL